MSSDESNEMNLVTEVPKVPGIPIQPFSMVTTRTVKSFAVRVINLQLFQSVTVVATLYDENRSIMENRTFTITGDEYLAWNNDDSYLVNLVASKMGFTLA